MIHTDGLDFALAGNQQEQSFVDTTVNWVAATGIDILNTTVRSLTFGAYEDTTEDWLSRMGADSVLSTYDEYRDSISIASLIGGAIVPGLAAVKAVNFARNGMKGANWFSTAGREENLSRVRELYKQGAEATADYRQARKLVYKNAIANGMVDNVAAEFAIVMTQNAHPMMEDYMENPLEGLAWSLALGGVLSSGIDTIIARNSLAQTTGRVAADTLNEVRSQISTGLQQGNAEITNFVVGQGNIQRLEQIAKSQNVDNRTREEALRSIEAIKADNRQLLERAVSSDLLKEESLVQEILNNPATLGAEKMSYFNAKDTVGIFSTGVRKVAGVISDTGSFLKGSKGRPLAVVYDPKTKSYVDARDAERMTGAADFGGEKAVSKRARAYNPGVPNTNYVEEMAASAPGEQQLDLLAKMDKFRTMDSKDLAKVVVAEDDYATNVALIKAMQERRASLRTMAGQGDVNAQKELDLLNETKFLYYEGGNLSHALSTRYMKDHNISKNQIPQLHGLAQEIERGGALELMQKHPNTSPELRRAIADWIDVNSVPVDPLTMKKVDGNFKGDIKNVDGKQYMRYWLNAAIREPYKQHIPAWAKEMLTHDHRTALQNELRKRKLVDADDRIFLYRGQKVDPKGHHAVESYTTSREVARNFAGSSGVVEAYQIDVKDIIGYVRGLGEYEFLVEAPTRTTMKDLTKRTVRTNEDSVLETIGKGLRTLDELEADFPRRIGEQARSMISSGMPMEEIMVRTGLTKESVESMLSGAQKPFVDFQTDQYESIAKAISELSSNKSRLVQLTPSNALPTYAHYVSKLKSQTDHKQLDDISNELTRHEMEISDSAIAQAVTGLVRQDQMEVIKSKIGLVNSELASGRFFKSADFYLRRMEEVGRIVSNMSNQVTHFSNELIEAQLAPVAELARRISKDPADIVMTNTAYEVYKSLDASLGKIRFKDGSFQQWISDPSLPGKGRWQIAQWNGQDFVIPEHAESIRRYFEALGEVGRTIQSSRATRNKILGKTNNDIGYHLPNFNPEGKLVHYVHVRKGKDVEYQVIWGKSIDELAQKRAIVERSAREGGYKVDIITPQDRNYKQIQQGMVTSSLKEADLTKLKSGRTATPFISDTAETMSEMQTALQRTLQGEVSRTVGMLQHDLIRHLDDITAMENSLVEAQGLTKAIKERFSGVNPSQVVKAMLQGKPITGEYTGWSTFNNAAEWALSTALNAVNVALEPLAAARRTVFGKNTAQEFAKLSEDLEKKGYVNPWKVFETQIVENGGSSRALEAYRVARTQHATDSARRAVSAANGLAATFALRLMELGQPLVNAVSLPILSYSAMSHKYDDVFMGQVKQAGKVHPMEVMYNGMRMLNDPDYADLRQLWSDKGYVDPIVSEATKVIRMAHIREPGFVASVEEFLDSKAVGFLSKPSDFSEKFTRYASMAMGTQLAVRLYGFDLATDAGRRATMIFANDFTNRAIGNYVSSQRPVLFQGTAGAALGLFQTYMLTFAQNMFRHLEVRDYKALGTVGLLQAGVFGVNSWPGFDMLSNYIGEHFSDNNKDLRTGIYEAIPNQTMANSILYGLPASMGALWGESNGIGMSTRGELSVRFPGLGGENIASASMIADLVSSGYRVLGAAADRPENTLAAMGEALSLQSVSRPIARVAEMFTGRSLNQAENVVATQEEIFTPAGIMSRILSMRSADEVRQRQAFHLNSMYAAADAENRKTAIRRLRTAIREGNLSDEVLSEVAEEYLQTGSPQGFRSIMQHAVGSAEMGLEYDALRTVSPESPLWRMLNDI